MQSDDSMRHDGKTINRQSWSHITALSNLRKNDYCPSRRDISCANAMIRKWTMENPTASEVEKIGFFRIVVLTMQLRGAANRHMLLSGQSIEDGDIEIEEFHKRKDAERKTIPQLDQRLADALAKTGETKQQMNIDESIKTSAEAASVVYARYRLADGDN